MGRKRRRAICPGDVLEAAPRALSKGLGAYVRVQEMEKHDRFLARVSSIISRDRRDRCTSQRETGYDVVTNKPSKPSQCIITVKA